MRLVSIFLTKCRREADIYLMWNARARFLVGAGDLLSLTDPFIDSSVPCRL